MERIYHYNTINLLNPESQMNMLSFSVPKGDNSHSIYLKLTRDGEPYVTAGEASAVFVASRPDGTSVAKMCDITNQSVIRYDLDADDASVTGLTEAEIWLYGAEMTSPPLPYDESKYYVIDDYCTKDGEYWKCYVATHGAWEGLAAWESVEMQTLVTPKFYINVIPTI